MIFFRNQFIKINSQGKGEFPLGGAPFWFLLTIFLYAIYMAATQPAMVFHGEMWAEMATNYFFNANSSSYLQKLISTDAGYIPAPQRLIAFIGNQLHLSAASIPYLYTWSAIICTGMLVGVFCLPQFRRLVPSDLLRFLTAISVLMFADFETRTFINFTYYAAFFIAVITALAFIDHSKEISWWAWFIPILMVSKPAVLSALPAMIMVALISKSRFRYITIISALLCAVQILQMVISLKGGATPFQVNEHSLFSKLVSSILYFFGFLGGYFAGPIFHLNKYFLMLLGFFILFLSGFIIFSKKSRSSVLIITGLSLLFFNALLNAFTLSNSWGTDMALLDSVHTYRRHIVVGFMGCMLALCGFFSSLINDRISETGGWFKKNLAALFFLVWFVGVGWLSLSGEVNREPSSPTIDNSQWQSLAGAIDSGISPLCVPIDPWWRDSSWMYRINCGLLSPAPNWDYGYAPVSTPLYLDITPPKGTAEKNLVSAAVLIRPLLTQRSFVQAQMIIRLVDGSTEQYYGSRDLNISGGLLLLAGKNNIPIKNISSVRIVFNIPVEIALAANNPAGAPGVAWMGN